MSREEILAGLRFHRAQIALLMQWWRESRITQWTMERLIKSHREDIKELTNKLESLTIELKES